MTSSDELSPLIKPLESLQRLLNRFSGRGMIIGGVAASLLGKPRLTADLDAVILLSPEDVPLLIEIAREEGMSPRLENADEFARRHHILLLRHVETGIPIDISLGMLPMEVEAVERSIEYPLGELIIRLPTPEDLIILKAVAHRPKDLADIQAVIDNHPDLDRARIKYWVKEFADTLEMPEIWDDVAVWLEE
jgi:hypothetical protein